MKKAVIVVLALVMGLFAEGSREGDSLALVAMGLYQSGTMDEWGFIQIENDRVVDLTMNDSISNAISNLTELYTLNLEYSGQKISDSISKLKKLTNLYFLYNQGTTSASVFPSTLCQITSLKALYIDQTGSSILPSEIGNLVNLEYLYSSHLTTLPNEIGNCKNLVEIVIYDIGFDSIPKEIGMLTQLEYLYSTAGKLTTLPQEIGNCNQLKELCLTGNNISSIPLTISNLKNLKELDLSRNNLISLHESISQLESLETLDLSYNMITKVPRIDGLQSLKDLDMTNNKISIIPTELPNHPTLETFDFSHNELVRLPSSIMNFENSYKLRYWFDGNPLSRIHNSDELNYWLDEQAPGWDTLQKNVDSLQNLFTEQCISSDSFNIAILDIFNSNSTLDWDHSTKLASWEGVTYDNILKRVSRLTLSNKNISEIPSNINYLTKMAELDLSNNNLTTLPKEIGQNTFLKTLNLANNQLVLLPKEITNLTPRTELDISGNNLQEFYLDEEVIVWLDTYDPDWRETQGDPSSIETVATVQRKPLSAQFTGGSIQFSTAVPAETKVSLFDFSGREIFSGAVQGRSVAVPPLARGIYLMKVRAAAFTKTMKLSIN